MSNNYQETALKSLGAPPPGSQFVDQEYELRDVIAFPVNTDLVPKLLFTSEDKDVMYKSNQFPSNTQGYILTHLKVNTDLVFKVTTPAEQAYMFNHFVQNSYLRIEYDGVEILRLPIHEALAVDVVPTGGKYIGEAASEVFVPTEIRAKFNSKYKLANEIEIGAGKKFQFEFIPAKGLTTNAGTAPQEAPYHPQLGLASNKGYIVDFRFTARKIRGRDM